jgi:drug/metabolite transporter (DMT)-like permease
MYVLRHLHTGVASMGMMMIPIVALVSAHWHFGETTSTGEYFGFALIGAALALLSLRALVQQREVAPVVGQE